MERRCSSRRFNRFLGIIIVLFFCGCQEKEYLDVPHFGIPGPWHDTDSTIFVSDDIVIKDKRKPGNSPFSYTAFQAFLEKLVSTGRFMFVPMNELSTAKSYDKVIISLRHDIDYDINSALRFARREYELGIRGTYFILHTADYYSRMPVEGTYYKDPHRKILRKNEVLKYIKKIQNDYNQEIGWHNDMVTLKVVYNINPGEYLKQELSWLRNNGINITGTSSHGSQYCYIYHYVNFFFWKNYGPDRSNFFYNYDYVNINNQIVTIDKYNLSDFGLTYEAGLLANSLFLYDNFKSKNQRWHMDSVDWNSFKPGSKIIILFHPALWDSF